MGRRKHAQHAQAFVAVRARREPLPDGVQKMRAFQLQRLGFRHGWAGDYALCAWSHDEIQVACRTQEIADIVAKVATDQVTVAGEIFNFRCRLDGASKQGTTWAETH